MHQSIENTDNDSDNDSDNDNDADFGNFATNNNDQDDVEELAEPGVKYVIERTPHIFYPVCIGEVLNMRYRIDHKLGHGGFSTVWMARDLYKKEDIALKIMGLGVTGEHDYHMQNEIRQKVQDTSRLVVYLDTFLLPGRTREGEDYHRVLVLPLKGPPLSVLSVRKLSMSTRMSAAKQLLEALESLHKSGIIHGGEFMYIYIYIGAVSVIIKLFFDRFEWAQLHVGYRISSQS